MKNRKLTKQEFKKLVEAMIKDFHNWPEWMKGSLTNQRFEKKRIQKIVKQVEKWPDWMLCDRTTAPAVERKHKKSKS